MRDGVHVEAGVWVRAARRSARLSQRELATAAGVPASTISRIEAAQSQPQWQTMINLLSATGHHIVVQDEHGTELTVDGAHEGLRDGAGRHFPAHLEWEHMRTFGHGSEWWGWFRIAWSMADPTVPAHTYSHRPRPIE